jgi:methionyl-tRNA synthetase
MGKSLGNVLDPEVLLERCGADAVRWYLLRDIPFGDDGDFQQQRFSDLVNNDLANTIGNLLNRTSSMARRWFDGGVPPAGDAAGSDHPLALRCTACATTVDGALEALDFRTAAAAILELAETANGFLNDRAPWKAIKAEENRARVAADLYAVLETSRWVAVLLAPLLPDLSGRMLQQLAQPALVAGSGWTAARHWGKLASDLALPEPTPVLHRLELDSPL